MCQPRPLIPVEEERDMAMVTGMPESQRLPMRRGGKALDIVRFLLAMILLTAAALKGYQLATGPVTNKDIFSYRWTLTFQVEFEIVLGLWLGSGRYKRLAWAAALACVGFFSCITLHKALSGEASCGCFGQVEVNPWYTLILDLSAVAALLVFRPDLRHGQLTSHYRGRLLATVLAIVAIGVPAGILMGSYRPAQIAADGSLAGAGSVVVLEPKEWVGKEFPLCKQIDVGERLAKGTWIVLFHRHGCPVCGKAVPVYQNMAQDLDKKHSSATVALIEVPTSHGDSPKNPPAGDLCLQGRLSDANKWFIETPAVVLLVDGKVLAGWEGQAPQPEEVLGRLRLAQTANDQTSRPSSP